MRVRLTCSSLAVLSLVLMSIPALAADDATGAKVLFDGSSLDGWEHVGAGRFVLEDGVLRTEGGMGLLWYTKERFGDCVIRVVYKTERGEDNSGVFIRIAEPPTNPWYAVHHGYEVQICDTANEFHRTGSIYSLARASESPGKPGEWNTLEITLDGDLVRTDVNGVRVTTFDPSGPVPKRTQWYEPARGPRPATGYIGLQNHDPGDTVFFKEVSVRPLMK